MEMETDLGIREENNLLSKTFFWMFLGLLSTAIIAGYTYYMGIFETMIQNGTFFGLIIAQLVVVLVFSLAFTRLPAEVVGILFFVYAMLTGVTMSLIFTIFYLESIIQIFVGAAILFGGLAVYGYKTKADLSNWGPILLAGLIIGLILTIVNIFIGNSMLDLALNWAMLIVFCGLTIYDMNKLKAMQNQEGIDHSKAHIFAAMQLYLDFINIFIRLLWLFGKRR